MDKDAVDEVPSDALVEPKRGAGGREIR